MTGDGRVDPRRAREALSWFLRLVRWDLALLHGVPSGERATKAPGARRRLAALRSELRQRPRF